MKQFITVLIASVAAMSAHADPHNVYGVWMPPAETSHIEISDCGDGTPCGTVVWLDAEALPEGVTPETAADANGDNVLGLQMLHSFKRKENDWRSGTIYDPEHGKTYGSRIKLKEDGTLQVKGCIGPFCQTQVWTKVAATEAGGQALMDASLGGTDE